MNLELIVLLLLAFLIAIYLVFRGLNHQIRRREEAFTKEKEGLIAEIQHLKDTIQVLKIDKARLEKEREYFQLINLRMPFVLSELSDLRGDMKIFLWVG